MSEINFPFTLDKKRRDAARAARYMAKYNLTLEDRDKMFEAQGGRCAICRKHESEFTTPLHIEHDHSKPYLIRGLVCFACNSLIPCRKNLQELLYRVLSFITQPPATRALGGEHFANSRKMKKRKKS